MTFAWRPGSQYHVAATRGADSVLASDCRAQFGRPSTRRGCRICVTVRLPVRRRGETMYWQANANTPLSVTPLLNVPYITICPETITEIIRLQFPRCKNYVTAAEINSPRGPIRQNYGTEIAQIPCKNYGAQK